MTDATARVRKYQFGASMCQISPERLGWAMFPALSGSPSIGTPTGAGYHPLMHPVLKSDSKHADRRLRRLHEGSEDCTRREPAIFATFVQSSRAASIYCDHSLRPPQPRGQKQSASPALREPIPNHTTLVKRQLVQRARCSTAGVRPRQGLALHTLQHVTDPDPR